MSKPIFINKTIMDEASNKEYLAINWRQSGGAMRVVLFAVAAFGIGYAIYQLVFMGTPALVYSISMFLLGFAAFFMAQWGYILRTKSHSKAQIKLWEATTLEKEVLFFEDRITQTSRLGTINLNYNRLTKYTEGKNVAVLNFGEAALLFKKDCFTQGSLEELKVFLAKKCPQLPAKKITK